MQAHAGEYGSAKVLGDPVINDALKRLLGPELVHLQRNLQVSGPVDLISCDLVISGNAEHQGGEENAIVAIDIHTGAIAAAIMSQGEIAIYADTRKTMAGMAYEEAVPLAIKDWIAVIHTKFHFRFHPPANTRLLPPPGANPPPH